MKKIIIATLTILCLLLTNQTVVVSTNESIATLANQTVVVSINQTINETVFNNDSNDDFNSFLDDINLTELYYDIQNSNDDLTHVEILNVMHETIYLPLQSLNEQGPLMAYPGGVNDKEFWTLVLNLWPWEYGTAQDAKNKAVNKTIEFYGDNTWRDDGDAFRHTYFASLLTHEFGAGFAKEMTNAHESYSEPGIDKDMDLHNNSGGIDLYNTWKEDYYPSSNRWDKLADFIVHCVGYGRKFNIVKLDDIQNPTKIIYTTKGIENYDAYPNEFKNLQILPIDYGFECEYFFYPKAKNIEIADTTFSTNRLRTGYVNHYDNTNTYVDARYLVLSYKRQNAGIAYLSYDFDENVSTMLFDLSFGVILKAYRKSILVLFYNIRTLMEVGLQ